MKHFALHNPARSMRLLLQSGAMRSSLPMMRAYCVVLMQSPLSGLLAPLGRYVARRELSGPKAAHAVGLARAVPCTVC